MFERFTGRARRVVVMAQDDARGFGHGAIEPAHILLALTEESEGVAGRALAVVGADAVALRSLVESAFESVPERKRLERLPFTKRSKKVLELSLREALQLGHSYIGTEHLLLGLLRLTTSEQPDAEDLFGLPVKGLRKAVLGVMSGSSRGDDRLSPALGRALDAGKGLAGRGRTTTGHLLLAIVDDPQSQASRALASIGVTREPLAQALAGVPVDGTTDATAEAPIEVHVGTRAIRVTDPALAARLSSATADELLGALQHLADKPSDDTPDP